MHITSLRLQNFRRYSELQLDIPEEGLVLVGTNGAGKTTVLDALASCLSRVSQSLGGKGGFPNLNTSDVRHENVESTGSLQSAYPLEVETVLDIEGAQFSCHQSLSSGDQQQKMSDWPTFREGINSASAKDNLFPLVALFPAHRGNRINQSVSLDKAMRPTNRADGYSQCFTPDAGLTSFSHALTKQTIISLQEERDTAAKTLLEEGIETAIPGSPKISYSAKESAIVIDFPDQGSARLSQLSGGQQSLLDLVASLIVRSYMLNPHLEEKAVEQTPGVVLIDELDLHLHPAWQRGIFGQLRKTFPKIQFIVTTHSPQILGEVPKELVGVIGEDVVTSPNGAEGMDANWVLKHLMDTTPRSKSSTEEINEVEQLVEKGNLDAAQTKLERLRSNHGPDPETQRLAARISKLQLINK